MKPEPGTLAFSHFEGIVLAIGGRRHLIALEDVAALLVFGRVVPIFRESPPPSMNSREDAVVTIEGHAAITRQALKVCTRTGSFIVPLVSVQRVVRGVADSAALFPFLPDWPEEEP